MVEKIKHKKNLIALILRANRHVSEIEFYTSEESAQQIGEMGWNKGHEIKPHVHKKVKRTVERTQEVLFIQKGKVRVDLYDDGKNYLESRILDTGDIIFLSSGGHGFTMLEDTIMVEVKQGPYLRKDDKERFESINDSFLKVKY